VDKGEGRGHLKKPHNGQMGQYSTLLSYSGRRDGTNGWLGVRVRETTR